MKTGLQKILCLFSILLLLSVNTGALALHSMGGGFTCNSSPIQDGSSVTISWDLYPSHSMEYANISIYKENLSGSSTSLWSSKVYSTSGSTTVKVSEAKSIYARAMIVYKNYNPETFTSERVPVAAPIKYLFYIPMNVTMMTGETYDSAATLDITPTYATNQTLRFTTSNAQIATVDQEGFVTAHKTGSATITAHAQDGSGKTANLHLTVEQGPTEINMPWWLELLEGEVYEIDATVLPQNVDQTLEWSSSDAEIASVDQDGVVTAHKVGSAVITAKAVNGLEAKCAVDVCVPAQGIDIGRSVLYLETTGMASSYQFPFLPIPGNGLLMGWDEWSSSDPDIVEIDEDGVATAVSVGEATITCTSEEDGLSASCRVIVQDKLDTYALPADLTGIEAEAFESNDQIRFVVIPNGTVSIGDRAFADCEELQFVYVPASVTEFGEDIFSGSDNTCILFEFGSPVEDYVAENGLDYNLVE